MQIRYHFFVIYYVMMDSIDNYLLIQIFSYLDFNTLSTIKTTSKQWHQCVIKQINTIKKSYTAGKLVHDAITYKNSNMFDYWFVTNKHDISQFINQYIHPLDVETLRTIPIPFLIKLIHYDSINNPVQNHIFIKNHIHILKRIWSPNIIASLYLPFQSCFHYCDTSPIIFQKIMNDDTHECGLLYNSDQNNVYLIIIKLLLIQASR